MSVNVSQITIRPLDLQDLDAIFMIDHEIRNRGKAVTYEYLTTEHIFTINRKVSPDRHPTSYIDLITGNVSDLLEFGIVGELAGHVRGFILGRIIQLSGVSAKAGEILILGVHPDYWNQGIASKLLDAICETFRSRGIKSIRIEIDQRDKILLKFCEHSGFGVSHRITFSKTL